MANIHIFYNPSPDKWVKDNLKIKIDDSIEYVVEMNQEITIDMNRGMHNIKMYVPWLGGSFGFRSETIEIPDEDQFYYYQLPMLSFQKGKFIRVGSSEDFLKAQKKSKTLFVILLILSIIIFFLLVYPDIASLWA